MDDENNMNYLLLPYMVSKILNENADISGSMPDFYTPKWIKKHKRLDAAWPYVAGLIIGLMPLGICLVLFKITGIF